MLTVRFTKRKKMWSKVEKLRAISLSSSKKSSVCYLKGWQDDDTQP